MSKIIWDNKGKRFFETGVDRGVFYSSTQLIEVDEDNSYPAGFPWNGLISVDVTLEEKLSSPLYFDGEKTLDLVRPGDFSGTLKAFTCPDEFLEIVGFHEYEPGLFFDNQMPGTFGLCYRTKIGNDINSNNLGYKLHIIYNLTAVPEQTSNQTVDSNVNPIAFSWTITAVPEKIYGYRPSAHLIIDSTKVDSDVLQEIENVLYGTDDDEPMLLPIVNIISYIGVIVFPIDGGRFIAIGPDSLVSMTDAITFEIDSDKAVIIDADTYQFLYT